MAIGKNRKSATQNTLLGQERRSNNLNRQEFFLHLLALFLEQVTVMNKQTGLLPDYFGAYCTLGAKAEYMWCVSEALDNVGSQQ